MPRYVVVSEAALQHGKVVDAADWETAVKTVAAQSSGRFLCVPVTGVRRVLVSSSPAAPVVTTNTEAL